MTAPRIDLVLPCLDEAAALPKVLASVPVGIRAIVVDNGSTDGSPDVARRLGAHVVTEERRGFGAAAHAGLLAATAPLVAFCDADGSMDPCELLPMAELVESGEADLVMARRRPRGAGSWPLHGRIGNAVLARRLSRRVGVRLHDLGPLRVARREDLLALDLQDRRSGYPLEMVLKAGRAGWRIVECDGSYVPRIGTSKVTGTVRGTLTAVRDMTRWLREA